ncbi:MAG: serine/threonine-protein kinase, partial [Planctomycetota bacterium]
MNHQRKCPTESALRDFCLGRLEPDMWDDVSSHVDDCAECQTTVVGMDDTHDSLVRELRTPTEDSSGQCDIRRLIELANAGRQSAESDRDQQTQIVSGSPGSDSKLPGADGVLGQYRLLALLGEGGMGSVYRAEHMRLKRPVAVKVLSGKRFSDPASTDRFQREIESLGQLQHPHIVNATDAGEADGIQYLVMEHVDGIDFSRLAQRIGPLRVPDACELIRQAALGLQHAHECGFIHRDIKPANLMLACDAAGTPVVKILDLGLARLCHENASDSDLTQTGQVMGTADYMPPEQSTGEIAVDIRSDLYSLGCTLYRLLAGQAPFSGPEFRTAFERMRAHVELAPPSVTTLREDVPAGLDAIIQRLLAKSPDDRFQTPLELAEALGQFTAGCDLAALLSGKVHGIATRRSYESAPDNSVQVPRQSAPAAMGTPLRLLLGLLVLSFLIGAGLWAGGMLPPGNAQSEATTPPPNSGGENGDSTGALNAPPEPDDMKSLFDGKTLEGWDGDSQLWS